ncbi:MAG: hypothetical protein ACRET3_09830 [Burkholderiales bacterium]
MTAKLSRKFYDKLGDDVANELVEWLNSMDATHRADLRELNDLNFARFDAKLEQRTAELHAKIEQRTAELHAKLEQFDARLEQRIGELTARLLQVLAEMKGDLRAEIAASKVETLRWNFVLWAAALGSLVALLKL